MRVSCDRILDKHLQRYISHSNSHPHPQTSRPTFTRTIRMFFDHHISTSKFYIDRSSTEVNLSSYIYTRTPCNGTRTDTSTQTKHQVGVCDCPGWFYKMDGGRSSRSCRGNKKGGMVSVAEVVRTTVKRQSVQYPHCRKRRRNWMKNPVPAMQYFE